MRFDDKTGVLVPDILVDLSSVIGLDDSMQSLVYRFFPRISSPVWEIDPHCEAWLTARWNDMRHWSWSGFRLYALKKTWTEQSIRDAMLAFDGDKVSKAFRKYDPIVLRDEYELFSLMRKEKYEEAYTDEPHLVNGMRGVVLAPWKGEEWITSGRSSRLYYETIWPVMP